jgi:hypothetical protein
MAETLEDRIRGPESAFRSRHGAPVRATPSTASPRKRLSSPSDGIADLARPRARPTLGNRLKAFVDFSLTPFYPGYDFDQWDRRMAFPKARPPSLSIVAVAPLRLTAEPTECDDDRHDRSRPRPL